MQTTEMLAAIDAQIAQLQQARELIAENTTVEEPAKRRGRPRGSVNKTSAVSTKVVARTSKRTMSEEGKARIAAAQKARWAAQKRASRKAGSVMAKKAGAKSKPSRKTTRTTLAPATPPRPETRTES